ncbi:MAG TPA: hypothetical protein VIS06_08925 [Mycobacteriales bacterium]
MDPESGVQPPSDPVDLSEPPDLPELPQPPEPPDPPDPARTVIFEATSMAAFSTTNRRPRCVVLLPAVSGVDTSTTAAGLALALASVQPADVLLLDMDSAPPGTGLATRFGLYRTPPGALMPVAPRLTYEPTGPGELVGPWPERFGLLLVHCGPAPSWDVLDGALTIASSVLLLTPDTAAGLESATAALDWLCGGRRAELAREAVVVLAGEGEDGGVVTEGPLPGRCRVVLRIPAAAHLAVPGVLDPDLIPDGARDALLDLAKEVPGSA